MRLIPTAEQWAKWSLPSKLTAIGAYTGGIALVAAVFFYIFPREAQYSGRDEPELQPADFRLRITVASYSMTEQNLAKAPKVVSSKARIADLRMCYDLILVENIDRTVILPKNWTGG
jgi:hypothetical protein